MKQNICYLAALLCLMYDMIVLLYVGRYTAFSWFWPLAAAVFFLAGYPRTSGIVFPLLCIGLTIFAMLLIYVISGMQGSDRKDLAYVIVEGSQVKGTKPSRSLQLRLDKAYAYAVDNPDTILILSGGMGRDEEITEARCMWNELTEKGLSPDCLVLEERSTTTYENLVFSNELTDCASSSVGLVTNNFHIRRSLWLAGQAGYTDVCGISAAADGFLQVHFVVRETVAMAVYLLKAGWRAVRSTV